MRPNQHPEGHVFYRRMGHRHPEIQRGEGVYLYDVEGNRFLDGSGGALVANVGHGVQKIVRAMAEQASRVGYLHATMFTSAVIEAYSEALSQIVPISNARLYYLSSGSEAVEAAIKLARQIQYERGKSGRYLPISRWQSYHGTTLGALAVTGKPRMRNLYKPMFVDFPHIPPPYCFRCPYDLEYPQCEIRCALALEEEIKKHGPELVSAFVAEPISGATLGVVVPPPEYWPLIREICDQYEILLIADEVMTGMGRTGKWFAIEHWSIEPDIMTIGKGAAGGYFPLGIVAVKSEYVDAIYSGTGEFNHGGTYSHHAVGAAAGLATLEYIQQEDFVHKVSQTEGMFRRVIEEHVADLDCVGDIRGKGFLWGVELVADRETKEPFDPKMRFAEAVADEAFHRGLIVYPSSGCVDGVSGDLIMIGPPFSIGDEEIEAMMAIIKKSILQVRKTMH